MQIFIQVMECGSFTRAAELLHLPRSTVSTEIQALEDRLGIQLLRRTTRRINPTHEGTLFLEAARDCVDAVEASEQMFRRSTTQIRGRLRVDMPSRIGRLLVIPNLPDFVTEHPAIHLELSMTDRVVDMVSEGVDCVVRVGTLENSELICRKLLDISQINCASPAYLSRFGTPSCRTDLDHHHLVNYAARLPATKAEFEFQQEGTLHGIAMTSQIAVDNAEAYISAAQAGLGLIQIPAYDVQCLIQSGELVEVLTDLKPPSLQLSLLYAKRRNLPARIRAFQEWIGDLLVKRIQF